MDGKQTKIYEYAISDATSVKLTGHISTMNVLKGGAAKITIQGFSEKP
jgi:hypothetical protein